MPHTMTCECGRSISVTDAQVGYVVRCTFCGQDVLASADRLEQLSVTPRKLATQILVAGVICLGLIFVLALANTYSTASKGTTTPTQQQTVENDRIVPRATAPTSGKPNPFQVTDSLLKVSRSAGRNIFQYTWSGSIENRTERPVWARVGLLLRDSRNDDKVISKVTGEKRIDPHTNGHFSHKLETARTVKEYDVRVNWATVGPDGQPQTWWNNSNLPAQWWVDKRATDRTERVAEDPSPTDYNAAELSVSVLFDGTQFHITNRESVDWINVLLDINSGWIRSGYTYTVPIIPAGSTYSVGVLNFAKKDGTRFNPFTTKPTGIYIYCSTAIGKRSTFRSFN